jgi:hypothetical protein
MARKRATEVVYVHKPQEGRFVVGVPQRYLTQADVDRLGPALVGEAVATGLYQKATKTEAAKAEQQAAKAEEKADGDER